MPRRWSSGSCCATVARGSPERAPDRVNDGTDTGGSESARDADAVTTLPWCDVSAILSVIRRGGGDPTYQIERVGVGRAIWKGWRTPQGPVTVRLATLTESGRPSAIRAWCWGRGAAWTAERLPRMLGGQDDASDFVAHHPEVAEAARRHEGWAVPWTGLVVESLVPAVLEQLVTGVEAFAGYGYLVRRHGGRAPGPFGLLLAPSPEGWRRVPSWEWAKAGVDGVRARTVLRAVGRAGRLEECVDRPLGEAHQRMRALPGIGVWTAAEVAHRALGDADAVSFGDYHVAANIGWALTGTPIDDDALAELLAPYAGHRYRVQRLLELGGVRRPRHGPRMEIRTHTPSVTRRRV